MWSGDVFFKDMCGQAMCFFKDMCDQAPVAGIFFFENARAAGLLSDMFYFKKRHVCCDL